jgi:hypothetical protein
VSVRSHLELTDPPVRDARTGEPDFEEATVREIFM